MIRYIAHRLLQSLIVIAIMSVVIYGLIGLMPGDPVDIMVSGNPQLTTADADRLRKLYGVDRPIIERYGAWASAAITGDLGYSRTYSRPVFDVISPRLANTALLMIAAFLTALLIGLPAGIYAATRPNSPVDAAINLGCFITISVPSFWLALMLILLFAVILGWLPASGLPTAANASFGEIFRHLILPITTLAIVEAGTYARYMRAAMIEALNHDYVRTARAKGASPLRVVIGHALRNALLPVVTIMALGVGGLFSGALVTETMFAYPGMGKLIFDSVMANDFNVALVALLFATALTLLGNLAADLGYAALDPRISFADGGPDRGRAR